MSELGLALVRKLNPIKFRYDQKKFQHKIDDRFHLGLSAQELISLLPIDEYAIVNQDRNGFLMVDYTELIGPLISSVKEMAEDNESLRATIKEMGDEITKLRELVYEIKGAVNA